MAARKKSVSTVDNRLGALRPPDALTIALQPATVSPGAPNPEDARLAALSGWPDRIGRLE